MKFFALLKICKSTVIHQYLFLYVAIYSVKSYNTMGYILRTRKFPNTTEDTKWYLQVRSSIIVIIWTEHQIALQSQLGENIFHFFKHTIKNISYTISFWSASIKSNYVIMGSSWDILNNMILYPQPLQWRFFIKIKWHKMRQSFGKKVEGDIEEELTRKNGKSSNFLPRKSLACKLIMIVC